MERVPPQDRVEIDRVDALAAVAVGAVAPAAVTDDALVADDGCGGGLIITALPASASITKISIY